MPIFCGRPQTLIWPIKKTHVPFSGVIQKQMEIKVLAPSCVTKYASDI